MFVVECNIFIPIVARWVGYTSLEIPPSEICPPLTIIHTSRTSCILYCFYLCEADNPILELRLIDISVECLVDPNQLVILNQKDRRYYVYILS